MMKRLLVGAVVLLASALVGMGLLLHRQSSRTRSAEAKAMVLENYCARVRFQVHELATQLTSDRPSDVERAARVFDALFVVDNRNSVDVCLPVDAWPLVDPAGRAELCGPRAKNDAACMARVAVQAGEAMQVIHDGQR
jgi:hypothetical protein